MAVNVTCMSVEQRLVCSIIPPLSYSVHKGQAGRIGIIGGSKEYTGAPYFAAISALKTGCDLVHVMCTEDSASVIKTYSPELIVHPILDSANAASEITKLLTRFHSLVIGPGLGRNESVFGTVREVIENGKKLKIPIILDADALFFINSNLDLISGYKEAILTPNVMEFSRLHNAVFNNDKVTERSEAVKLLSQKLGNVTIVQKGPEDVISDGISVISCKEKGSPRRCGGQGDLLSGAMSVFAFWGQLMSNEQRNNAYKVSNPMIAALGACMLTRRCNREAFQKFSRSTTTTDMIGEIRSSFSTLFPVD